MTNEQVQKKRAIDRENQRHFRAKNKALVRQLEEEVESLTQRLEDAEARVQTLEQQLEKRSKQLEEHLHNHSERNTVSHDRPNDVFQVSKPHSTTLLHQLPLDLGSGITLNISNTTGAFSFQDMDFCQDILEGLDTVPALDSDATGAEWSVAPLQLAPTNRMDHFIMSTVKALRNQLLSTQQQADLTASSFPNISSFVDSHPKGDPATELPAGRPLSSLVAAYVFQSPVRSFVERLAVMYHLSHFVRWLVCRTKETYDIMPPCLRPSLLQRTVPHPAWVDFVLFPEARDEMIRRQDGERFEEFRAVTGDSLSINWPFTDSGAVQESDDGQSLTLSPIFEAHIRNGKNWTVGPETARAFPYVTQILQR